MAKAAARLATIVDGGGGESTPATAVVLTASHTTQPFDAFPVVVWMTTPRGEYHVPEKALKSTVTCTRHDVTPTAEATPTATASATLPGLTPAGATSARARRAPPERVTFETRLEKGRDALKDPRATATTVTSRAGASVADGDGVRDAVIDAERESLPVADAVTDAV